MYATTEVGLPTFCFAIPGHLNTGASNLFKPRAILAHQKYWQAKQMKHLNFCPKLIVISQKKRSSLEISLGFHYFSLKTSDVGKNKRKRSFYIKSVFDFLRNFCQNRQDRAPKSCPKTIQRAVSKFRDKSDPARDKGRQKSIPGLSRPFRDGWQPYYGSGLHVLRILSLQFLCVIDEDLSKFQINKVHE